MTTFGLNHDSFGRLVLIDAEGRRHVGVDVVRCFPISDPEHWLALVDADGREIACIEEPASLPAAVRQVLDEELQRRDFIPVIERIERISAGANAAEWQVVTDRGPTQFLLKSDDDVRRLGKRSALVIDAYGVRYHVPNTRALDLHSRRLLERYL